MIEQHNGTIRIPRGGGTVDVPSLFVSPYPSDVSPDVEHARRHTLAWLTRRGIITDREQAAYVDAMRLDMYAARVAPQLTGAELNLFTDWIVYTTQLDDHVDTDDPARIEPVIRAMVAILDHDDPGRGARSPDVFVAAFADLWSGCQHIPQPWRAQMADRWAQWLEAYLMEAGLRRDRLWPSAARYRETVRWTSAAVAFPLLSDHLSGLYVPDRLLNSSEVTVMRALVPDHTMAVNDAFSAWREETAGDHLNSVFVLQHEYGLSRDEALERTGHRAGEVMRHFMHCEDRLPTLCADLDAGEEEQRLLERMSGYLRHWFAGNLAWHVHDTARYRRAIEPLGGAR
ncbi:hypothetical protein CTZ27_32020 [Streptomyces griseocarneus]|nr:hypothetical protein CTZ27_32020 [Streptomyces griseocarneus]